MKVSERYNWLSTQLMYEWTLETPTAYNRAKRMHLAFFMSVKDLYMKDLKFDQVVRLEKIAEIQQKELRRPKWGRR